MYMSIESAAKKIDTTLFRNQKVSRLFWTTLFFLCACSPISGAEKNDVVLDVHAALADSIVDGEVDGTVRIISASPTYRASAGGATEVALPHSGPYEYLTNLVWIGDCQELGVAGETLDLPRSIGVTGVDLDNDGALRGEEKVNQYCLAAAQATDE